MANPADSAQIVRFGEFELDLRTGELRTNGDRLILQEKPFQLLTALLERPGEMVSRDELIKRLWPAGTFIDFDLGLNKAVNRLREALSDSAEQPHFIETFPKRGYRFVATVTRNGASAAEPPVVDNPATHGSVAAQPAAIPLSPRRFLLPLGLALGLACMLAAGLWIRHRYARSAEPVFQRLSFGRGTILSARFTADGQSVVYGAAWSGKPFQLFWTKTGSSESRSLGVDADILAISPAGELAVLVNPSFREMSRRGTLALMSLTSSAPRKVLDNVQDADWSPDGSKLAVTHFVDDACALEFPLGNVLYHTTGDAWLSHPRVSPRGDQIAFLEHPLGGGDDDAGWLAVTDLAGHKKTLSRQFGSISGLAWSPDGEAIWFSGSEVGSYPRALFKVTTNGQQLLVRQESSNTVLHDVSRDGHLLLTRDTIRGEVFGRIFPETTERELGWGDNSFASDLTPDGTMIALSVQGEASGQGYDVYLRKTDGSPAVRLGDGIPIQFSPDGKWILTSYPSGLKPASTPQLVLLPTGAGQPVTLTHDSINHGFATLLPDGKRFLFDGVEPEHASRTWVQDGSDGKPQPITPEGVVGNHVSPDGKLIAAVSLEHKFVLYPVDGGQPTALSGIERGEVPIGWSADCKHLFVATVEAVPVRISRTEVSTGRRQFVSKVAPNDLAGLWGFVTVHITPDGKSYVYSDYRILSDLYLETGLK
ncbi:MAG TPA: winged helix-turn-helix domain-containing protein [Candidatus Dormibacteraeota bacterium]|nr:winged helix-turn-helix domain-containing protein [Candidatus Dormibacteraeota bacterium]